MTISCAAVIIVCMTANLATELPDENYVPDWDLADRMAKALRVRGVGVALMAESFGKSRATIGRWINGHGTPSKSELYFWAVMTGVDHQWLETGEASPNGVRLDQRACRDSNPKPSVWEPVVIDGGKSVKRGLTAFGPLAMYGPLRPVASL